jgi:hypothetical protein
MPVVLPIAMYKGKPGFPIKRRPRTTSHPQLNLTEPLSGCMCSSAHAHAHVVAWDN